MDYSQFEERPSQPETIEAVETHGATCDTYRVKLYGKLHFLKRLKPAYAADIRYQEAFRKEFETGYRLEHPYLVRYVSLSDEGLLMEYVDGETLAQRLASHPDYFRNKENADKFLRQLLDVVGYLHAHQVLHLDLKPDNIMLTRINSDVKLIDLGCCHTDAFTDTQGHTDGYAAPEQLSGGEVDARTDIFAIGRIMQQLPDSHIYNKVATRCMAPAPARRYQSVEEVLRAFPRPSHGRLWLLLPLVLIVLTALLLLSPRQQKEQSTIAAAAQPTDSSSAPAATLPVASAPTTAAHAKETVYVARTKSHAKVEQRDEQMRRAMHKQVLAAYDATIQTFCDSVFPSPTVAPAWQTATYDFNDRVMAICEKLSKTYPDIPRSLIDAEGAKYVQDLIAQVFNRMRKNGEGS